MLGDGESPRVEITFHKQGSSKPQAFNQKRQPQLGQYGKAVMLALGQILQRLALAGPKGRPRPKVAKSVAVQASLLGHFATAAVVASDCMLAMLNLLVCAWKF